MNITFEGKRALVTGAGRGIGRSCALRLSEYGAEVIAVSRSKETLDSLKQEAPNVKTVCVDLSNWQAAEDALKDLAGEVEILVNNAGTNVPQPFLEIEPQNIDIIFDINLKALINVSQMVARGMVRRGCGGAIVNVSSQASKRALPSHSVYSASKAAVDQLTKNMAFELGKDKIRVNAVNPTVVLTDLGIRDWSDPVKARPMLDHIPLARFCEVSESVDAIMYLLSDKSSMISGAILPVDGGFWTC